ncbi:MAG: lysostaphin resistance A-like protein [Paracoccaceae bacterium]
MCKETRHSRHSVCVEISRKRPAARNFTVDPPLAIAGIVITSGVFTTLPFALILAVLGVALVNGTMEELFWRHALLDDTTNKSQMVLAVLFFGAWHLVMLFAKGITLEGGPLALVGSGFVLGALWMWARLRSGGPLAGVYSHIVMNFFAFSQLAALNLPDGAGIT